MDSIPTIWPDAALEIKMRESFAWIYRHCDPPEPIHAADYAYELLARVRALEAENVELRKSYTSISTLSNALDSTHLCFSKKLLAKEELPSRYIGTSSNNHPEV